MNNTSGGRGDLEKEGHADCVRLLGEEGNLDRVWIQANGGFGDVGGLLEQTHEISPGIPR